MEKIFLNIFIWFWFWLVIWFLVLDISVIWLNSYAVKCLHNAYETAYYFYLTPVRLFHESFACALPSFEYHLLHFY